MSLEKFKREVFHIEKGRSKVEILVMQYLFMPYATSSDRCRTADANLAEIAKLTFDNLALWDVLRIIRYRVEKIVCKMNFIICVERNNSFLAPLLPKMFKIMMLISYLFEHGNTSFVMILNYKESSFRVSFNYFLSINISSKDIADIPILEELALMRELIVKRLSELSYISNQNNREHQRKNKG